MKTDTKKKSLTTKQLAFVQSYIKGSERNATKAALSAGYSKKTAAQQASQLLKKPNIVHWLSLHDLDPNVADDRQRRIALTKIIRESEFPAQVMKAIDLLNKMDNLYSQPQTNNSIGIEIFYPVTPTPPSRKDELIDITPINPLDPTQFPIFEDEEMDGE